MSRTDSRIRATFAAIALVVLGLFAVGVWFGLAPDGPSSPDVDRAPEEAVRTVLRDAPLVPDEGNAPPPDPDLMRDAIRGELGVEARNRVCRLCLSEVLEHPDCRRCRGYADAGRLVFDIVDLDGRPFGKDISITAMCPMGGSRSELLGATGSSGFMDLPAGTCTLSPTRVASGFQFVEVEPVEVEIVEDAETYQLFELSDEPIGGVGVKLQFTQDGTWRVIDLIGSYAGDAIPVGAEILAIDGRPAGHRIENRADPRERLPGPVGTEVEVRFGYETDVGWVEETVILKRHAIERHEIGLGGFPG
jgi:hypothetical protein